MHIIYLYMDFNHNFLIKLPTQFKKIQFNSIQWLQSIVYKMEICFVEHAHNSNNIFLNYLQIMLKWNNIYTLKLKMILHKSISKIYFIKAVIRKKTREKVTGCW